MIFDALVGGFVRRSGWRALTSILAIALGVATVLALALTSSQTIRELDADRGLFAQRVDFQVLPFGTRLSLHVLERVRSLEGVASAGPIVDRPITIGVNANGSGGIAGRLVGADLVQPLPGVTGFDEERPGPYAPAGSFINPAELIGTNGAIVSAALAKRFGLHRGSSLAALLGARVVSLRIANVLPGSATGVGSNVVFVDVTTAQRLFDESGSVDRIDVVASSSPQSLRPVLAAAVGQIARVVVPAPRDVSLGSLTSGIDATFGALAAIGLAVAGLLVYNAVGTSIEHRRGDIGTLRALGVAPAPIVLTFVAEGAAYGALGGFLGAALAFFTIRFVAIGTGSEQHVSEYDVWLVALAVAMGIGVAVVVSIGPAVTAARIPPALAARQGTFAAPRSSTAGLVARALAGAAAFAAGVALASHPSRSPAFVIGFPLCFSAGTVLVISPLWTAIGGAVRALTAAGPPSIRLAGVTLTALPERIGVAFAALALATFAAIAVEVASTSFATSLRAWAKDGIAGDLIVRPAGSGGTFDGGVLARVRAVAGVIDAEAVRDIQTEVGSVPVDLRGEDTQFARLPDGAVPAKLDAQLAAALHVRIGDTLVVRAAANRDLRVRVVALQQDFSEAAGAIVVERAILRKAFGDNGIDAIRVRLARGVDPNAVATKLVSALAPQRIATTATSELRDRLTSVFEATFAFVGTLAIFVVAIASLGVASAFSAFVLERRFELQTLRTIGAPRALIGRMLALETLVIAFFGSALGCVVGIAFAVVELSIADPVAIGFSIPLNVPLSAVAAVLAGAIAASMIAPLVAAPAAFRIATDRRP